jgi:hypothetical protein
VKVRFPWFCVIKADKEKIKAATKVWIPKYSPEPTEDGEKPTTLWSKRKDNDEDISKYITSFGISDPEKALRFSYLSQDPEKMQMVIPTDMLNKNDLDLWAHCWEKEYELEDEYSETVNWKGWEGIVGNPGTWDPERRDFYTTPTPELLQPEDTSEA